MKRKYESWGDFLKAKRERKYRSAREFCSKVKVGISYPQYSRYEAGDQLPNLEQALELCRFLDIPVLEGLLEWSRSQISEPGAKGEVEQLLATVRAGNAEAIAKAEGVNGETADDAVPTNALAKISLDDIIVFNRSHLRLFQSDPAFRDIFTYINSFAPEWIAGTEIAAALGLTMERTESMLDQLSDVGVVLLAGGKCRATKRNFYFPDDPDFFALRNSNLIHNSTAILNRLKHADLQERRAYRGLITRELTPEQLDTVIEKMDELMGNIVSLPETANPDRIYSACVLVGERFARPGTEEASVATGLRRADEVAKGSESLTLSAAEPKSI